MIDELEQRRRDLMREQPDLYAYLVAVEQIKAYDQAGDLASGASTGESAANRLWDRGRQLRRTLNEAALARQRADIRTTVDRP